MVSEVTRQREESSTALLVCWAVGLDTFTPNKRVLHARFLPLHFSIVFLMYHVFFLDLGRYQISNSQKTPTPMIDRVSLLLTGRELQASTGSYLLCTPAPPCSSGRFSVRQQQWVVFTRSFFIFGYLRSNEHDAELGSLLITSQFMSTTLSSELTYQQVLLVPVLQPPQN